MVQPSPTHPALHSPDTLALLEKALRRDIRRLNTSSAHVPDEGDRSSDPLDLASTRAYHESMALAQNRIAGELPATVDALNRLLAAPGSFGACERCQSAINVERLLLLPTTRRCSGCT